MEFGWGSGGTKGKDDGTKKSQNDKWYGPAQYAYMRTIAKNCNINEKFYLIPSGWRSHEALLKCHEQVQKWKNEGDKMINDWKTSVHYTGSAAPYDQFRDMLRKQIDKTTNRTRLESCLRLMDLGHLVGRSGKAKNKGPILDKCIPVIIKKWWKDEVDKTEEELDEEILYATLPDEPEEPSAPKEEADVVMNENDNNNDDEEKQRRVKHESSTRNRNDNDNDEQVQQRNINQNMGMVNRRRSLGGIAPAEDDNDDDDDDDEVMITKVIYPRKRNKNIKRRQ